MAVSILRRSRMKAAFIAMTAFLLSAEACIGPPIDVFVNDSDNQVVVYASLEGSGGRRETHIATVDAGSGSTGEAWGFCTENYLVARTLEGDLVAEHPNGLCDGDPPWTFSQVEVDAAVASVPNVSGDFWTVENASNVYVEIQMFGKQGVRDTLSPGDRFYGTVCADPAAFVAKFTKYTNSESAPPDEPERTSTRMIVRGPTNCTFGMVWEIAPDDLSAAVPWDDSEVILVP